MKKAGGGDPAGLRHFKLEAYWPAMAAAEIRAIFLFIRLPLEPCS
jgi:hypothetical protein